MPKIKKQNFKEGDVVLITTTNNEKNIGFVKLPKNKLVQFVWWILNGFETPSIVIGMEKNSENEGFQERKILKIKKLEI